MAIKLADILIHLGVDDSKVKPGLNRIEGQTRTWAAGLGRVASGALAVVTAGALAAAAAFGAAVAGMGAMAVSGIAMNANLEQTEVRLQSLTGLGEELMRWVREISVATPFTTDTLSNALAMAKAYGFTTEQAKHLVMVAGDVDAAMAGNGQVMERILRVEGQMIAKGRVMSEEMLQLTEAGIPAWTILADKMGVSVSELQDMVTKGLVPAQQAVDMLNEGMEEMAGGSMEALSKTAKALWDSIREAVRLATADMTSPLFEKLKVILTDVLELLNAENFQGLISDVQNLFTNLTSGFNPGAVVNALDAIITKVREGVRWVQGFFDVLMDVSVGDIMEQTGASIAGVQAKLQESLGSLKEQYDNTIASIQSRIKQADQTLADTLGKINDKFGEQAAELGERLSKAREDFADSMTKLDRDTGRKLLDNQRSLQDRLLSLSEDFGKKRQSIEDSLAEKQFDLDQRLKDMAFDLEDQKTALKERNAEKRKEIEAAVAAAATEEERQALRDQLAELDNAEKTETDKLDAKAKRAETRLKAQHDHEVALLQEKLKREQEEYDQEVVRENDRSQRQRERIQEDHVFAIDDLRKRLGEQEKEIGKQQAKLDEARAKEIEAANKAHTEAVAGFKDRIAEETEAYNTSRDGMIARAQSDIDLINQQTADRIATLTSGPMQNLKLVLDEIEQTFLRIKETVDLTFGGLGTWWEEEWPKVKEKMAEFGATVRTEVIGAMENLQLWLEEHKEELAAGSQTIAVVAKEAWAEMVESIKGDIETKLIPAWDNLREKLDELGVKFPELKVTVVGVVQVVGVVIALVLAVITSFVQGVIASITALLEGWSKMAEGLKLIAEGKIVKGVLKFLEGAIQSSLLGVMWAHFETFVNGIIDFFIDLADRLVGHSIIPDIIADILDAFDIDWLQLGKDIVDGIADGIAKAATNLINSTKKLAQDALNAAKNTIGAHSPSEKAREELGQAFGEGFALGVEDMIERARQAVASLLDMGSLSPALAGAGAFGASGGGGSSSQTNFNLTINSNAPVEPIIDDFAIMKTMLGKT